MDRLEEIRSKWKRRYDSVFDDESDDDSKKSTKYHGGGGNTRLPYGLCKGAGIDTEGMSPKEAWQAYEDKTGVSASEAYSEHFVDKKKKAEGAKKESVADGYKKKAKELISKKVSEKEFNDFLEKMGNDENLSDSDFYDLYESSIKDWKKSFGAKIDKPKGETRTKEKTTEIKTGSEKKTAKTAVPKEESHKPSPKEKNSDSYGVNEKVNVPGIGECTTSKRVDERRMKYMEVGDEDWTPFTQHEYSENLYEVKDKKGNKYVYDKKNKKVVFNGSATEYEDYMYDASEDSYLEAGGDLYKKYGDDYEDDEY